MGFDDEIRKLLGNRSAYLDFSHQCNPGAVDWPDPLIRLFGLMPDNRGPHPVEGTVMGFGTLQRAVCNVDFTLEIPSITIELIDPTNWWRSRAVDPIYLLYRWIALYLRVGGAGGSLYDQRISVGQITKASFGAAKHVSLECQLTGGKWLGEMIPRRTVTTTDFPRCPPENIGKAVPIVFGVFSNALDAYGQPITGSTACRPRSNILLQETFANGNGIAFLDFYYYERWEDGSGDPKDELYPLLRSHEANHVYVNYTHARADGTDMVGYGVNVLWLQPGLDPHEYYLYAGCAFSFLGDQPWGPNPNDEGGTFFDATEMWATFTYYPALEAMTDTYGDGSDFFYNTIYVLWDDAGYFYGLLIDAVDYGYNEHGEWVDTPGEAWLEFELPRWKYWHESGLIDNEERFFVRWGNQLDLVDTKQEFVVCHKCGTYNYDPTTDTVTVAEDGYFRVYLNGALFFAKENIDLILNDGWYAEAGKDHSNQQYTISFGWATQVGPLTGILITNGTEEVPAKAPCEEDPETAVNLASGALPALLVDTGKRPTHPDYVDSGFTPVASMPTVDGHEAHNVFGGGTINRAVFFYVAARKETGEIGPISSIVDLDNDYNPAQAAHAASLSWWKEGDATAYVVWMTQDPNFHPVTKPNLGSPRTKIIRAINHSSFPPIDEDDPPFDYQVKFTSLQDGAPYGTRGGTEGGYRYLLAGHTLQGVDQVYVLKPMPTVKADAEVNTLQENVALGAVTIKVAFDSDNDDLAKFQKDQVVIIAGDPDPYTITSSDEGTHGISPPARKAFTTGTVVQQAEDVDTQVLQREGTDYTQQVIEVNNNRYHTLVFPIPQQNAETCALYEVTCNVRGSEMHSDGSGVLIDHGVSITQHFFKNWIFNDYRSSIGDFAPSGNRWFEDVPYQPGLINNASFYAANLVAAGRMGTNSYMGAGALTEQITAQQLITDLITSFDLDVFFDTSTGQGAWSVAMFNPESIVRAAAPQITPEAHTIRDSFTLDLGTTTPHANVLPYFAGPLTGRLVGQTSDESGGWVLGGELKDPASIAQYGQITGAPLELRWCRHAPTAYSVATHRLRMLKAPAVHASMTVPIGTVNESLATVVAVTHPDGLGPDGWDKRLCRIMRSDVDLDRMVLHLLLRDVDDLIGP